MRAGGAQRRVWLIAMPETDAARAYLGDEILAPQRGRRSVAEALMSRWFPTAVPASRTGGLASSPLKWDLTAVHIVRRSTAGLGTRVASRQVGGISVKSDSLDRRTASELGHTGLDDSHCAFPAANDPQQDAAGDVLDLPLSATPRPGREGVRRGMYQASRSGG